MGDFIRFLPQIDDADEQEADSLVPTVDKVSRNVAGTSMTDEEPRQTLRATALVPTARMRLVDFDKARHVPIALGAAFVLVLGTGSQMEAATPRPQSSHVQREVKPGQTTSSMSDAKAIVPAQKPSPVTDVPPSPKPSAVLHHPFAFKVQFSSDSKLLVTAPANWSTPHGSPSPKDRTVVVWDVATGRSRVTIDAQSHEYLDFELSPKGRKLAVWSEPRTTDYFGMVVPSGSEVEVWDLTSGKRTTKIEHPKCMTIRFLDGGQTLATIGASEERRDRESAWGLRLWDTATGEEKRELPELETMACHPVFAPDDSRILACLAEDDVGIWKVASGKRTCTINQPAVRFAMGMGDPMGLAAAFSADGRLVALETWEEQVLLVDADTGEFMHTLGEAIEPDYSTFLNAPYFTPDGKTLVTKRGKPWAVMTIQLWDVATGEQRAAIEHLSESVMDDELMSSDGKVTIVGSPQGLALWNVETGTRQSHSPIEGRWPQLSQDGTLLMSVCGDRKKLWDTKTGTELAVITGGKLFKLSPDGKSAASYNLGEGIIEIWDVDDLLDAAK